MTVSAQITKNDSLLPLFVSLKKLLSKYKPPLIAVKDEKARFELEFDQDYKTKSGKTGKISTKHGMYFAGLIIQKSYVGLYFMPAYSHADKFTDLSPRLRKSLKGKTCFYIKKLDDELKQEIIDMLEKGYQLYESFENGALFGDF